MRLIRLKLKSDVTKVLSLVSSEYGIDDPGFTEDIFSLMRLKGKGLPSAVRIRKLAESVAKKIKCSPVGLNLLMSKRKIILEKLQSLPYFRALSHDKDLLTNIRRLLGSFQTLYRKVRQSQCLSCQLLTKCDFGSQYRNMTDITRVVDPNYEKKVHADCPFLPEIDGINRLSESIKHLRLLTASTMLPFSKLAKMPKSVTGLQALAEEAEIESEEDNSSNDVDPDSFEDDFVPVRLGSYGSTDKYANQHLGQHICQLTESAIDEVTGAQLALFELGKRFEVALGTESKTDFKPVPQVERTSSPEQIVSERDVTKLVASQHGLPKEVFDHKLSKKTLVKREFHKADDRKKLLYLLIDSSFSMSDQLGTNSRLGFYTKGSLASVFGVALIRKVRSDKGIAFLRFFEGYPGTLYTAQDSVEFDLVLNQIVANNYGGAGTDIPAALSVAIDDIKKADQQSPLAKAEILMITDCEDGSMNPTHMKDMLGNLEFNVLDVSGSQSAVSGTLKTITKKYFKATETAVDVNKLVTLI